MSDPSPAAVGAAWLPGLDDSIAAEPRHAGSTVADASFEAPVLDEKRAARVAEHVRAAALTARASHRVADIVEAVAASAARLADSDDSIGGAAVQAVRRASGCTEGAAVELLREHATGWTERALNGLLVAEFGDPEVLDGAQPDERRPGRRRRAVGPPLMHLVLAGNVPGVAVTAVIRCLLVRSGVLCRLASSEPWLVGLFARALYGEDEALGHTVAATWWPTDRRVQEVPSAPNARDTQPAADVWIRRSGKVIVYGGAEAVRAFRARTPPSTPLVEYGPRTGVAILGPGATEADLSGLATDTFAYEQAGCVSPRLVYLLSDDGGSDAGARPNEAGLLLERLGRALSDRAGDDRGATLTEAEALAIREARSSLQFGAEEGEVRGPPDLAWTILYRGRPDTYSEPLPRVLWVYGLAGIEELGELRGVLEGRIQAVGVAGFEASVERRVEELAVELGVSRITRPGRMAWPPPDWRHDGQLQLLPLVRWTDFETRREEDDVTSQKNRG